MKKNLLSICSIAYPQIELKLIFRTSFRVGNLFKYKDIIPKRFKAYVVYRVQCTDCEAHCLYTYYLLLSDSVQSYLVKAYHSSLIIFLPMSLVAGMPPIVMTQFP